MPYFNHRRQQAPIPATPPPATAYPVDEDGDRIYTEEDYAVAPDGDAFMPDDAIDPDTIPVGPGPFSYQGSYDTMRMADDDLLQEADLLPEDEALLADEVLLSEEDLLADEELQEELRRTNWRLAAGLANFAGVIAGTAIILLLVALLVSLCNWLIADVSQSFILLQTHL